MRISDWSSDVCSSDLGAQRIGDLILDDTRRLAGPLGADDDLGVGQVRQRVQRSEEYRQHAPDGQRKGGQQDQAAVGDGGEADRGDHGVGHAPSVTTSSAYFVNRRMSMHGDWSGSARHSSWRTDESQYTHTRAHYNRQREGEG